MTDSAANPETTSPFQQGLATFNRGLTIGTMAVPLGVEIAASRRIPLLRLPSVGSIPGVGSTARALTPYTRPLMTAGFVIFGGQELFQGFSRLRNATGRQETGEAVDQMAQGGLMVGSAIPGVQVVALPALLGDGLIRWADSLIQETPTANIITVDYNHYRNLGWAARELYGRGQQFDLTSTATLSMLEERLPGLINERVARKRGSEFATPRRYVRIGAVFSDGVQRDVEIDNENERQLVSAVRAAQEFAFLRESRALLTRLRRNPNDNNGALTLSDIGTHNSLTQKWEIDPDELMQRLGGANQRSRAAVRILFSQLHEVGLIPSRLVQRQVVDDQAVAAANINLNPAAPGAPGNAANPETGNFFTRAWNGIKDFLSGIFKKIFGGGGGQPQSDTIPGNAPQTPQSGNNFASLGGLAPPSPFTLNHAPAMHAVGT